MKITLVLYIICIYNSSAERITTIQLDGIQYYISQMNPFIPELNYFLAYQYCRSLGLQLVSFETKEKADLMMKYLKNTGYAKYDFWTSGNRLGTDMFLWMSTGSPFNSTFNYMNTSSKDNAADASRGANPQQVSQKRYTSFAYFCFL
ncbi:C-type lectin 37Da [Nasonia vitripennis]|uniref:C-type lectin domain-containing protein n=1 Tax=Nasonia vitripennis TaxID=7425 RepID=A0A7M7TBB7_NASVI|nr:C-type lectin 37Da [Nasonia vitripennis]